MQRAMNHSGRRFRWLPACLGILLTGYLASGAQVGTAAPPVPNLTGQWTGGMRSPSGERLLLRFVIRHQLGGVFAGTADGRPLHGTVNRAGEFRATTLGDTGMLNGAPCRFWRIWEGRVDASGRLIRGSCAFVVSFHGGAAVTQTLPFVATRGWRPVAIQ